MFNMIKVSIYRPVGVCCSNAIKTPVVYREGMFGNKNTPNGKLTSDSEDLTTTMDSEELTDM